MSKQVIHHDRQYFPGSLGEMVQYYCGITRLKGDEVPREPPKLGDHCRRCIYAKQRDLGENYMRENGYPIVRYVRSNKWVSRYAFEHEVRGE